MLFRPYWALCFSVLYFSRDVPSFPIDRSTEITAKISASPSHFRSYSKTEGVYTARQTLPPYHVAGERRRQVSLNLRRTPVTAAGCAAPCAPQCPACQGHSQGQGTRVVAGLAPHSHPSCRCSVQRCILRPPGSKAWSPHHPALRGHWLWRGLFTSSASFSTWFPTLWVVLAFWKYPKDPLEFTELRISLFLLRFMAWLPSLCIMVLSIRELPGA